MLREHKTRETCSIRGIRERSSEKVVFKLRAEGLVGIHRLKGERAEERRNFQVIQVQAKGLRKILEFHDIPTLSNYSETFQHPTQRSG